MYTLNTERQLCIVLQERQIATVVKELGKMDEMGSY